jgi:hypothetical protein
MSLSSFSSIKATECEFPAILQKMVVSFSEDIHSLIIPKDAIPICSEKAIIFSQNISRCYASMYQRIAFLSQNREFSSDEQLEKKLYFGISKGRICSYINGSDMEMGDAQKIDKKIIERELRINSGLSLEEARSLDEIWSVLINTISEGFSYFRNICVLNLSSQIPNTAAPQMSPEEIFINLKPEIMRKTALLINEGELEKCLMDMGKNSSTSYLERETAVINDFAALIRKNSIEVQYCENFSKEELEDWALSIYLTSILEKLLLKLPSHLKTRINETANALIIKTVSMAHQSFSSSSLSSSGASSSSQYKEESLEGLLKKLSISLYNLQKLKTALEKELEGLKKTKLGRA